MKKTATLTVYTPWGTANSVCVDINYRGKRLYSFAGHKADTGVMLQKAITWANNQGFTSTKTVWGN